MFGLFKPKKRRRRSTDTSWWASLAAETQRLVLRQCALWVALVVFAVGGTLAASRLEGHVQRQLAQRSDRPILAFIDLPTSLATLAQAELRAGLDDLIDGRWTDPVLCRDMAAHLASVGWIEQIRFVRRTADGRLEVSARYRQPVAMVQQDDEFLLVDHQGIRLPGFYLYDPSWKLIQGVGLPAPPAGVRWAGDDIVAALALIARIEEEPFHGQITSVMVDNFRGRRNSRRSHVELATDSAGGRIRWGSAPGDELEENTVEQKLAILRANFQETGRADARHPVIDISTFPDRFTIPG